MTETPVRETAQIIPFPSRSKGGKGTNRDARQSVEQLPVAVCDFGSGWYHDAAMQDEARKRPSH